MGEMGVNGDSQNFTAEVFELLVGLVEGDDFGGADEGEIEGIPEEEDVLSGELFFEVDGLDFSVVPDVGLEVWGLFSDEVKRLLV